MTFLGKAAPGIVVGHSGGFFKRAVALTQQQARTHWHLLGAPGSGKSNALAHLWDEFRRAGLPATLLDPHGDTVKFILRRLIAAGVYSDPAAYKDILYLDIPGAAKQGRYLPFNILHEAAASEPATIARNVLEAMHRCWPSLANGAAPAFDSLILASCQVLASNRLPLTALFRLLTDRAFREALLQNEPDEAPAAYFRSHFDRLSDRDRQAEAASALRRAYQITASPVLRHSLGQEQCLDFPALIDGGASLLVNMNLEDEEAGLLLGCLWTASVERAAKQRSYGGRHRSHHLFVDEFSNYLGKSERAFTAMLSQLRKYEVFLVCAHQNWSQASDQLREALQNVGVELIFRVGADDARRSAPLVGRVDPMKVKHAVEGEAGERGHPLYLQLQEQWQDLAQHLQEQWAGHAHLKMLQSPYRAPWKWLLSRSPIVQRTLKTPNLPDPRADEGLVARVEAEYLRRYFRPAPGPASNATAPPGPTGFQSRTRRRGEAH